MKAKVNPFDKNNGKVNDVKSDSKQKDNPNDSKELGAIKRVMSIPEVGDLLNVVKALAITYMMHLIAQELVPVGLNFYVREVVVIIFALLILKAIDSITKNKPIVGKAVIIFLFIWLVVSCANHYVNPYSGLSEEQQEQLQKDKVEAEEKRIEQNKADSLISVQNYLEANAMVLNPGVHNFTLNHQDSTGWLTIPPSGKFEYNISSKTFNYKIKFSDGTIIQGTEHGTIPWRAKPVFQVKSLEEKEVISITIKKI